jgi:hypothetical protein
MVTRSATALLLVAAAVCLVAARSRYSGDITVDRIESIVKTLSEISGFSEEHPVPYGRMSKRQLRGFLSKRMKKTLQPAEIKADELALKMFGLVPQDFDLKRSTIDLLTEQAAAFYDYDAKRMFLLQEPSPAEEENTTLAHELSHALADQHFDLEKFMDESPSNDDENLAHTAVVEGEASWLMIAYELKQAGRPPVPSVEDLKAISSDNDDSSPDFPVLRQSPLYIRESLLFPYAEGTLFFDAVYRKMGKRAFTHVFRNAPVDSAQIIHPQGYFDHVAPAKPTLPGLALTKDQGEITSGDAGEFDHEMMIRQYIGPANADAIPAHLRGSVFKILAQGRKHRPVLNYASLWDGAESAGRFFDAYKTILRKKWRHCDVVISTPNLWAGSGDNGFFVTHVRQSTVFSVEGLQDQGDWERLKRGS